MALDMDQLRKMFYEECRENLEVLEDILLNLDVDTVDDESINTIFRAAHSIKGGAGTFNLIDIMEFTHAVEAYLDLVRNHEKQLTVQTIDILLKSCDCISGMLAGHESDADVDEELKSAVSAELANLLDAPTDEVMQPDSTECGVSVEAQSISNPSVPGFWKVTFVPHKEMFFSGNDPLRILRGIKELDDNCSIFVGTDSLPELPEIEPELCYLRWTINLDGQVPLEDVQEVFEWVEDECDLEIEQIGGQHHAEDSQTSQEDTISEQTESGNASPDSEVEHTTSPDNSQQELSSDLADANQPVKASAPEVVVNSETSAPEKAASPKAVPSKEKSSNKPVKAESSVSSIRVDIDKVDSLINLVGELVITQSMLTEIGNDFSIDKLEKLKAGLSQLLQNSKDLQENVLNIRMLPMSFAFSRFPRLVRDLSGRLEKKVNLNINGENTELDKTVLERIVDPLVHLVRNGIDHGIEQPADRVEAGKPEEGTIELNAYHQGGSIVIQIKDDGAGLNCDKLWNKAIEKGVLPADARREEMSEKQVMELIFAPGFSTAAEVSDISGRGVGMDVVKRNIEELGGHIELESELGKGSCFTISLPLTLAILDGQLVKVAGEVYIIPLLTIIESIQIDMSCIKRASGGVELYRLREENIPILRLQEELEMGDSGELQGRILCFVEAAGNRVGLLLDELLDQQQVVIKSLESNYTKVSGISGATILGDGSVSLILDIQGLITQFKKRSADAKGIAA